MKKIGYLLVYGIVYIIGLLPFGLLYFLSDVNAFLLYHVIRYRRKVVRQNLQNSFPEKSITELKKIGNETRTTPETGCFQES